MATGRQDQILRFLVQAEGTEALVPFIKTVKELEGASDETRKAADALLNQLAEAARLQSVATSYEAIEKAITGLAARAEAAKAKAAGLADELARTENPSKRQREAFDNAQASAGRLATQLETARIKSASYAAELQAAGVNTSTFAKAQEAIAARGLAASKALADLAKGAKDAGDTGGFLASKLEAASKVFTSATQKLGEIGAGVKRLRTDLTELNQGLELAGKAFGALKGVAGFFVDQAKQAGSLEDAMAAVQAVTGATGDEFEALKAAAVEASERTRFGSVQAAEGLAELARAGFSANEAMQVLNPALAIAQGQQLSVAQASEYLTTTLTQFGLGAGDAARVADVLAAAADSSQTSVQQLGNALSYVAPLANQAGLNIEETSAIIGALADQGFRGERAGTALRSVFSSLSDPSSKFSQALRDAGIESRDFATVIEQLAAGGDRTKRALLALDSEARPAIQALVNAGGTGIGALEERLNSAAGAAERTSQILGGTFTGALERAQNAIANARNSFLEPLLDPLQRELDLFAQSVNSLSKSQDFALIAQNFAAAVDQFIQDGKRLASEVDFKGLIKDVREFSEQSREKVGTVTGAFEELVKYPLILGDVVQAGAAVVVESFAGVANDVAEVGGLFSETSQNAAVFFDDVAQGARAVSDRELAQLQQRLTGVAVEIENAKTAAAGLGVATFDAAQHYRELALAMLPEPVRVLTEALIESGVVQGDLATIIERAQAAQRQATAETERGTRSVAELNAEMQVQVKRLEEARRAYQEAFDAGSDGAVAAFEEVKKAGSAIAELRRELDAASESAAGLGDAFEELGIQSQKNLQAAAQRGREAFDAITAAAKRGEAAQADVNRAFQEYARRLVAVAETSDDATRRQILQQIELAAQVNGVSDAMLATATSALKAGETIAQSGDRATESWRRTREEAQQTGDTFREAADKVEESSNRIVESSRRTSEAMQDQRAQTIELSDEWRALADAIGVNTLYWDRAAQDAEMATERLRNTSKLRREALEETERAIDKVIVKEKELAQVQAQAGGINYGSNAQADGAATSSSTGGAGGRPARVELVLRNEQGAGATSARVSTEDAYRIANLVLAQLRDGRSAAGL